MKQEVEFLKNIGKYCVVRFIKLLKFEVQNRNIFNCPSLPNNPSISPHDQIQVHLILETMPKSFSESL